MKTMTNRNKLRKSGTAKVYTKACVITLLLIFILVSYIIYAWLRYVSDTGAGAFGLEQLTTLTEYIGAPQLTIPLSFETIVEILIMQAGLWWVYLLIAVFFFLAATGRQDMEYKGIEKGSANWGNEKELQEFLDDTGIPQGNEFYASIGNKNGHSYVPHNFNEIVIGGSGAGKSFRKVKPDIMQMFGSYVATDPKGELYRDTARLLTKNGYKVKVLNFINIKLTNSYNPFVYMREEQDVISIADLFMKNTAGEGEKEDFWSNSAKDLLISIMIYLWKSESETKSFGRVVRLANSIQYADGKIDPRCELSCCMQMHSIDHPNDVATVNWGSVKGTPEQTMGGIAKSLSTRLGLWGVEDVDMMTATDEMDFDNIGVEKTAVFLITPPGRNPYKAIMNMFYTQLFERLMYAANFNHHGRLPRLVSCELDEFANIGQIPSFNETLAVVRSHNIRICIVLQGLSQLKALYEKQWEGIIGNCSLFTYLGTNDMDTKEYIVKRLGKTTVRSETKSHNRGQQGGGSSNEHFDARDLVTVDELPLIIKPTRESKKYGGRCILFVDEYRPFHINKYNTLKHPQIREVGSSFKKDRHNNTNIDEAYADKVREKEERAVTGVEKLMQKADTEVSYAKEQISLRERFEQGVPKMKPVHEPVPVEEENGGEFEEEFDETNIDF